MNRPDAAGRMILWAVELREFDIKYRPRMAIKAQALVDFVVEFTSRVENEVDETVWMVKMDGLSNKEAGGVGVVLKTPKKDVIQYAIWLQFLTTNNEAKYEALLTGLKLTKSMGEYEAVQERMQCYLQMILHLADRFEKVNFLQILREQNGQADQLAKLASSSEFDQEGEVHIKIQTKPSTNKVEVFLVQTLENWMTPIINYLNSGDLPTDRQESRKLGLRASRFVLINELLYKRGFMLPYLRYLTKEKANCTL